MPGKDRITGLVDPAVKGDDYIFELGAKEDGRKTNVPIVDVVLKGDEGQLDGGVAERYGGIRKLVMDLHSQVGEPIKGGDDYRSEPVYVSLLAEEYGTYRMKQFNPESYLNIPERMTLLESPQYIILKIPNPYSLVSDIIAIKIDISQLREEVERFGIDRVTGMLESIAASTHFYSYRDYVDKLIKALRNQLPETKDPARPGIDGQKSKDGGEVFQNRDLAGIDFRGLPIGGQPAQAPVMMLQLVKLAQGSKMADMDKEWLGIQREIAGPSMPYEKIKEYIAVCLNKPDCRKHLDKAVTCLITILRIEEEQALPTQNELKDLLICLG
jgi:hypothetical protein